MKTVSVVACITLVVGAAAWSADEFRDAKILDVATQDVTIAGSSYLYTLVTVQIGEQKISARTPGPTKAFLRHHPETMVVGSTVPTSINGNVLTLKLGPDQKVVTFRIQRIESVANGSPVN